MSPLLCIGWNTNSHRSKCSHLLCLTGFFCFPISSFFICIDIPYSFNYLISFPSFMPPSLPQNVWEIWSLSHLLLKLCQRLQTRCPETAVQPSGTVFHGSQSRFATWRSASNSSIQASCTLRGSTQTSAAAGRRSGECLTLQYLL